MQGILVMCTYLTRLLTQLSGNRTLFSYVPEVRSAGTCQALLMHRRAPHRAQTYLIMPCAVRTSLVQDFSEISDAGRALP